MRITTFVTWAVLALGPMPLAAQEGMSFEDPFALKPPARICWRMLDLIPSRARGPMSEALQAAGEQTRPEHATGIAVVSAGADPSACQVVVSGARRRQRTASGFVHDLWVERGGAKLVERTTGPLWPVRATAQDFLEIFEEAWRIAAPPPGPEPQGEPAPGPASVVSESAPAELADEPPDEAPPAPEPFVDEDLARARASGPKPQVSSPPPTWVTLVATGGVTLRDLSASFGRSVDQGPLPAVGSRATLHFAPLLGARHALDLSAGYYRQFPSAELDGASLGASADRTRTDVRYAYRMGAAGPFLGAAVGFEFRRFVFDEGRGAVSIEYSVLRPGLCARQALYQSKTTSFEVLGRGHLRISLDDDSVSNDVGGDFGGGFAFRHRTGFVAELTADYNLQSGRSPAGSFDDAFLDTQLAFGWSL